MTITSQWFKAATAGPTNDGREVKDQWLIDIAETYDRKEHTAKVFIEHKSYLGNYGEVARVDLRQDDKGRNTLWMQLEPTTRLLDLNANHQYKYPSISIFPSFKGSGKAYLAHLGAVQDPASVGITPINFSNSDGTESEAICFSSQDAVTFEIEPEKAPENNDIPHWFMNLFKKNTHQDSTMDKQLLAEFKQEFSSIEDDITALKESFSRNDPPKAPEKTPDYAQEFAALRAEVQEFKAQLNKDNDQASDKDNALKDLENKFASLSSKLDAALKESDGKPTPAHTGDNNNNFSMV